MTTTVSEERQKLTQAEIDEAREYLERTRDSAIAATEGLSQAQLTYRPASGGWSIAGLLEHMAIIQEVVLGRIAQALADAPESPSSDCEIIDGIIKSKIADRSRKFPAPEAVWPTGRPTASESAQRLSTNTQRLIERLESTWGLRLHQVPSPPLIAMSEGKYQMMDGYQWLLAAAGHTERHRLQILEVKSEPGFPKSAKGADTRHESEQQIADPLPDALDAAPVLRGHSKS